MLYCNVCITGENNTKACCSSGQVVHFQQLAVLTDQMIPCPTCAYNYNQAFCQLTCSPKQASFVQLTSTKPDIFNPKKQQVAELNYYMSYK